VAFAVQVPRACERPRSRLLRGALYWHLLSLDAPTVAVLWAWSFERAAGVHSSLSALAVLGLGTWLIYIADRLLDSRPARSPSASAAKLRERHFFHARHRRAFLVAGAVALIPLGWLIAVMPAAARREDARLFAVALLYFAAVHLPRPRFRLRFPRTLAVALVFAAASAVSAWSASTTAHADLVWIVALFAALLWLNCAAIHAWERTQPPRRWSWISTLALIVASLAGLLMAAALRHPELFRLLAAMLASAMLLFALDLDFRRARRRPSPQENLSPLALRILADAALLTPLLLMFPWHR
jgi:hypothetical protein